MLSTEGIEADGWAARNELYEKDKKLHARQRPAGEEVGRGGAAPAEDALPERAGRGPGAAYRAQKAHTADEWVKLYRDGTVHKWLNQVTNFNVEVGAFTNPVPAERYFDASFTWRW